MKILNEKDIKLNNFMYSLVESKKDTIKEELEKISIDVDKIEIKLCKSYYDIIFLIPKIKSNKNKYFTYFFGIKLKDSASDLFSVKYVVDEEELEDDELIKLSEIIKLLKNSFKDYDKIEYDKIKKLEN